MPLNAEASDMGSREEQRSSHWYPPQARSEAKDKTTQNPSLLGWARVNRSDDVVTTCPGGGLAALTRSF